MGSQTHNVITLWLCLKTISYCLSHSYTLIVCIYHRQILNTDHEFVFFTRYLNASLHLPIWLVCVIVQTGSKCSLWGTKCAGYLEAGKLPDRFWFACQTDIRARPTLTHAAPVKTAASARDVPGRCIQPGENPLCWFRRLRYFIPRRWMLMCNKINTAALPSGERAFWFSAHTADERGEAPPSSQLIGLWSTQKFLVSTLIGGLCCR